MKILISAIACHPRLGSESKVGWDAARAISEIPGVSACHVMTHSANREAILAEKSAGRAGEAVFHFFGKPISYHPNRMLARLQSWLLYREWQSKVLARAVELHSACSYALTHHVTYASWRVPSPLWRLPIPFVLGPVGGGARTNPAFRRVLGPSARSFEVIRDITTAFSTRFSGLADICTHAAAVLAADAPTASLLAAHGARSVQQLCQVFFTDEDRSRLRSMKIPRPRNDAPLLIFAGGNLEGRKGTVMSLRALAILKRRGVPFLYTYGGWGPDLRAMTQLAQQLGIADQVNFHEGFTGDDYIQQLTASDVYLLPSVRETAGITMMEAMMANCYPIVLADTGAGEIAEHAGVTAIRATNFEEAIIKIVERLEWCYNYKGEMLRSAELAGQRLGTTYSKQAYQQAIFEAYDCAMKMPKGIS